MNEILINFRRSKLTEFHWHIKESQGSVIEKVHGERP